MNIINSIVGGSPCAGPEEQTHLNGSKC